MTKFIFSGMVFKNLLKNYKDKNNQSLPMVQLTMKCPKNKDPKKYSFFNCVGFDNKILNYCKNLKVNDEVKVYGEIRLTPYEKNAKKIYMPSFIIYHIKKLPKL